MKRGLGETERMLFAYVQMRGQTTLRSGELAKPLRLTAPRERNLLSRLAKAAWIARGRRGLSLVPRTLPLGGKWSPDEILALSTVMQDVNGRYQICGPNAFNRYGLDEQVPARVYAYNNRISGERSIGAVRLTLRDRFDSVTRYSLCGLSAREQLGQLCNGCRSASNEGFQQIG